MSAYALSQLSEKHFVTCCKYYHFEPAYLVLTLKSVSFFVYIFIHISLIKPILFDTVSSVFCVCLRNTPLNCLIPPTFDLF